MREEMIEEIDWQANVVCTHFKSELKKRMFPHKVSLIIPQDGGKLLLCRRAKDKHPFPDTWCCAVGGKVLAGESFLKAAEREMQEEVGVTVPLMHVTTFSYNEPDYQAIFAVFTTKESLPQEKFTLDPSEIQYLQAFSFLEIKEMIAQKPYEFASTFLAALKAYTAAM